MSNANTHARDAKIIDGCAVEDEYDVEDDGGIWRTPSRGSSLAAAVN